MEGVQSPRFKYKRKDADTLLVTYDSKWNLMPFFVGLVKGVGKYYEEAVTVNMWASNQMLITFPSREELAAICLEEREACQDEA